MEPGGPTKVIGPNSETILATDETISRRRRREAETLLSDKPGTKILKGRVMTSQTNSMKNLLLRTAAFIGLTAASTAVMALPYLA